MKVSRYKELMDECGLPRSYRVEFSRMERKIRPVGEFTTEQIVRNLFNRVQYKVIRNAKDFRRLGELFRRTQANAEALHRFLEDADMTVGELVERTKRPELAVDIDNLVRKVRHLRKLGPLPADVQTVLGKLRDKLEATHWSRTHNA